MTDVPSQTATTSSDLGSSAANLSLEALGQILERVGDEVVLVSAATGRIVHVNRSACRLLGLRRRELVGLPFTDIEPALDWEEFHRAASGPVAEADGASTREALHVGAGGREVRVELSTSRVSFDGDDFYLFVGRDLSERRTAEAEMRRRSEELLRIFEGLGAAVCVIDVDADAVILANALARERFGVEGGPHCCGSCGRNRGICPCTGRETCDCENGGAPLMWEFESAGDGRRYWSVARAISWFDGRKVCLEVTIDVTDRRRIEEEHARLAAAVEQAAEAIFVTDCAGQIVYVSPAFERITGWTAAEALGQTPRILKSGEHDDAFYEELWATLKAGEVFRGRLTNRRRDGSCYDADLSISPVRDATGAVVNYVAVQRDVTKEVEYEALLRQTQKLQAVGTLAAGVSHEFNNVLQGVLGFATLVRDSLPKADERRGTLDRVIESAERGADLSQGLEAFARGIPAVARPLDVGRILRETVEQLAAAAPPAVRYRVDVAPTLSPVHGHADGVRALLLNLCANAVDALPKGGLVRVAVEDVTLDRPLQTVIRDLAPGRYVCLRVEDDGVGIDREDLARLFDPFFTRKRREPGQRHSGLGLAVVYGILQSFGGGILVRSRRGAGTTVEVYLPALVEEVAAAEARRARRKAAPAGSRTVLVVDDEPDNVELARVVLRRSGYRVLTASDGVEALAVWEREAAAIDLVVLDIVMPRMDGAETFRRLRQRAADLPVLFATGYDVEGVARDVRDGPAEFLFKPYRPKDLLARVESMLGAAAAADQA